MKEVEQKIEELRMEISRLEMEYDRAESELQNPDGIRDIISEFTDYIKENAGSIAESMLMNYIEEGGIDRTDWGQDQFLCQVDGKIEALSDMQNGIYELEEELEELEEELEFEDEI
jgi:hypothetical protein